FDLRVLMLVTARSPLREVSPLDQGTCLPERAPGERRLQQLLRDESPRATAEPRPRPCARADLVEPSDRRRVAGTARKRPPEKVLVERERAAVRVAADEVDVQPLEVVRPKRNALHERGLEVRDVAREPRLDPVGIALARIVVPVE